MRRTPHLFAGALSGAALTVALACNSSEMSGSSTKKIAPQPAPEPAVDEAPAEDAVPAVSPAPVKPKPTPAPAPAPAPAPPDESIVDNGENETPASEIDTGSGDPLVSDLGCKKEQSGYMGRVYRVPNLVSGMPDFPNLTPVGQVRSPVLDIPVRAFTAGFPNVPDLIEWFGIVFDATLVVPADGSYVFATSSDDGSRLFLDEKLVVENGGQHGMKTASSAPVPLTAGKYKLTVQWYQGPRQHIGLQVFWKTPGTRDFVIIPAEALKSTRDCDLDDLGTF